MNRSKLFIVLALALLLALPAGIAQAQTAATTGTAVISDSDDGNAATISDVITWTLANVASPGAGFAYEGWLLSDDRSKKLSTGVMTVADDGTVSHVYTSPTGVNLIQNYSKVVITKEPVPDVDPNPSADQVWNAEINSGAMVHARHQLASYPPGASKGILTNLKEQLDVAVLHGYLAKNAPDLATVHLHAHHIINIIEGSKGSNFHAASGNPGDGVGVLAHANLARVHANLAIAAAPDVDVVVEHAKLVDTTSKNVEAWSTKTRDQALVVLTQSDIAIAKVFVGPGTDTLISLLESARNGFDADNDGTIAATAEEGGTQQAYVQAQLMATYKLKAGPLPAPPKALPATGDTSVPMAAGIALAVSLAFLSAGGFLLLRGRRSSTNKV